MPNTENKHYTEGPSSTFTHNGEEYTLDTLFELTYSRPAVTIPISRLSWVLKYTKVDEGRVLATDTKVPVLVYDDPEESGGSYHR